MLRPLPQKDLRRSIEAEVKYCGDKWEAPDNPCYFEPAEFYQVTGSTVLPLLKELVEGSIEVPPELLIPEGGPEAPDGDGVGDGQATNAGYWALNDDDYRDGTLVFIVDEEGPVCSGV